MVGEKKRRPAQVQIDGEYGSRGNLTRVYHGAQRMALGLLLGVCVPLLLVLLAWDLLENPSPVPAVVVIAGLVLLCFFFSYVFVTPDDLTLNATDRTLSIASKIFVHTRNGLTPEAALAAAQIILPETFAAAICFTDGEKVLASWGEGSKMCPAGVPVAFESTRRVMESGELAAFNRDVDDAGRSWYFPHMHAGIIAPLKVRGKTTGTLELYYQRYRSIDTRQTALARGFADLISTQLASFALEQQDELTARVELRALQSQVDPHFLFNTIGTIVSLVRTEPEKARSLLIDFSNYYRRTLSDSETLTSLDQEIEQGTRYINLMQARYGADRFQVSSQVEEEILDSLVPPFILQPLLENCIKHAMRENDPLHIQVVARETDDGIEILVQDDGVGMSEEVRAHLFDQRVVDGSESITADGSIKRGAGLALSNVLQRIHFFFGEESGMSVQSVEGKGTCVTVSLVGVPHDPVPLPGE